jgi:phytoene desaturase
MTQKKAIIIGAGFGGLSLAPLLAKKGYKVQIIEKNSTAGGRARVWKSKGFSFDMGPSWYLGPEIFEKYFAEFGLKPSDLYQLKRLDPAYRLFFSPDDIIDISPRLKDVYKLFDSLEENGAEKLKKYLVQSKYQYDVSMENFIYKEYKNIFSFINKKLLKEGPKLNVFDNMEKFTAKFFSSDKSRKIVSYTMVFLGGSPKNTPGMYAIMAHMDMNLGVWYPMGGFGVIVKKMVELAKKHQVSFIYNNEVKSILIKDGQAIGVKTNKGTYPADVVISNADLQFTETKLLPKNYQSYPQEYWDKKIISPSAFIVYLGVKRKVKNLGHHNLVLANDWNQHFNAIFDNPAWHKNPSYYISCPSKTDPTVAPKGMENIFILVPSAPGLNDTDAAREKYYQLIIKDLQKNIGDNFEKDIIVKRIYSHRDFIQDYHAFKGTALGMAPTFFQSAFFRPNHSSKKVKKLFYTGLYNHPGTGVPMVMISSQIAAEEIIKNDK